jgi:acyl-CoA dehydrogenase
MGQEQLAFEEAMRLCENQFSDRVLLSAERNVWPTAQWAALEEFGVSRALTGEEGGGGELPKAEALGLVRLGGLFAIPLPIWETMLANWLLAKGGLSCEAGATTVAPINPHEVLTLVRSGKRWRLKGVAHRVPWGADATLVAVAKGEGECWHIARLKSGLARAERGTSIAGEPRDTLALDVEVPRDAIGELPSTWRQTGLLTAGAALRTVAIAGALQRILEITVNYAKERTQFGRPIGRFQAVQQSVARLAGEVAAANAASDLAISAFDESSASDRIAVAKIRAGEAASIGAAIAHQVHGAIGFTKEYRLNFFTRRLWSWRDEFGGEAFWSAHVGRVVATTGADALWTMIVRL